MPSPFRPGKCAPGNMRQITRRCANLARPREVLARSRSNRMFRPNGLGVSHLDVVDDNADVADMTSWCRQSGEEDEALRPGTDTVDASHAVTQTTATGSGL